MSISRHKIQPNAYQAMLDAGDGGGIELGSKQCECRQANFTNLAQGCGDPTARMLKFANGLGSGLEGLETAGMWTYVCSNSSPANERAGW